MRLLVVLCWLSAAACSRAQSTPSGEPPELPAEDGRIEVYKRVGGRELRAFVYAPARRMGARLPALLIIHGGGWGGGSPDLFTYHARHFANRGFVAVTIGYRLTSLPGVTVHDCVRDVKSALRWLRRNAARFGINPRRIAAAGDSAGGHLAAALAVLPDLEHPDEDLSTSSVPDAAILWNPITETTASGWSLKKPDAAPDDLERWQRQVSPVHQVRAGHPPMLVIHGLSDAVVPIAQSERFVGALRAAGNRCQLVALPLRAHAFVLPDYSDPVTVTHALELSERFLRGEGW